MGQHTAFIRALDQVEKTQADLNGATLELSSVAARQNAAFDANREARAQLRNLINKTFSAADAVSDDQNEAAIRIRPGTFPERDL